MANDVSRETGRPRIGTNWTPERLKNAALGMRVGTYEAVPMSIFERMQLGDNVRFQAVSVGDKRGQAFIVPLDESSVETAEYILRAIAAYEGA